MVQVLWNPRRHIKEAGPSKVRMHSVSNIMSEIESKPETHYLVFTDAGEEADDQIALWYLHKKARLTIIFCGPDVAIQKKRQQAWEKLSESMDLWSYFCLTLEAFKNNHATYKYDAILQISPLFGFDSDKISADKYVLMGSVDNSVNCPKNSADLFRRFEGKPGTVIVESAKAATMRPSRKALLTMPFALVDEMISVGFKVMLQRCPSEAGYAEGLINCDVGRGANYTSVENMYQIVKGRPQTTFCVREDIHEYIDSLKPSEKIRETRIKMYKMYRSLDEIFEMRIPVLTTKTFPDFCKSDSGAQAFNKFRITALEHGEILNPMYDFYAAWVLIHGTEKDQEFIDCEW